MVYVGMHPNTTCLLCVWAALVLFPMSVKAAAHANGGADRDKLLAPNES